MLAGRPATATAGLPASARARVRVWARSQAMLVGRLFPAAAHIVRERRSRARDVGPLIVFWFLCVAKY